MKANGDVKVNREYKDRLFRFIFGSEENKQYLLSLYNAVNNSDYKDIDEIEITTLDDVIYIKQKNDIAFLLGSELNLYEQQSSYNPAVNKAVDEAIALNYLNGFFKRHRGGIVNMNLTEYNEEEFIANRRAEGREEGRAFGIIKILKKQKESDSNILQELVSCLSISLEKAEEYLNSYQEM